MSYRSATSSGLLAVSTGAKIIPTATATSGCVTGVLMGVTVIPAAAATTLTIYDNNAGDASGTALEQFTMPAGQSFSVDYAAGTAFNNGLSYVLSGTGAKAIVRFCLGG